MTERTGATAPDGALRELAEDPSSRKRFLRMMGGAGAASALAIFMAACGGDDDENSRCATTKERADGRGGDLAIVQYALTLEHLETDFYNAVIDSGVVKDKALGEVAKMIRDNEQEHVDALTATVKKLGGTPKRPKTTFDAVLEGGQDMVLQTAATVENLGAAAYLGQAGADQVQGSPGRRARHPLGGGSPRGRAEQRRRQDDRPRRRLREAGLDGRGPAEGQALPRVGPTKEKGDSMSQEKLMAPELAAIDVRE